MVKNKFISKIIACMLSIVMAVSMLPTGVVLANSMPDYYFVVSAEEITEKVSETETIKYAMVTITLHSISTTMANLKAFQIDLCYDRDKFTYPSSGRGNPGFDADWYNSLNVSADYPNGIAYIDEPSLNEILDGSGEGARIVVVSQDGYYIDENSDIYNSDETIAAKIKFTVNGETENLADEFELKIEAINIDVNGATVEKSAQAVQISDLAEASKIDGLIEELPVGDNIKYSHKADIEAARKAYEALSPAFLQEYVTKLDVLTAAETSLGLIQSEIDAVAGKIEAIGEVTLEDTNNDGEADSETKIKEAKSAYTALAAKDSVAAQSLNSYGTDSVNYIKVLETAEVELAELKKEAADKAKAQEVIDKIDAFKNDVENEEITLEHEAAIVEARRAYNEDLTTEQKVYVTNLDILEAAESQLATLKVHKAAAEALVGDINKIPQGSDINSGNVDDVQGQIDSAKSSYATISKAGLASLVTNWKLVDKAQTRVDELNDNIAAAEAFVEKVESICSKVDLGSGEKIDEALTDYSDLVLQDVNDIVAEAKQDLDKAKTRYDNMISAKTLIDALPEVDLGAEPPINEVTPACGEALEAAEEAYKPLPKEDKETIDKDNYSKLAAVRKAYDKSVQDVKAATDAIDAIGDITLESKDEIIAAKTAYESLTVAEKEYLETYNGQDYGAVLNNAYETYVGLVQDKEEADKLQAGLVMAKIDALNSISLQSGDSITAAEVAYDALTDDQETIVKSTKYGDSDKNYYERLEEIRKIYDELVADNNAVQAVITAINNIGTVKYGGDDDSNEKILTAEAAYDALVEADKTSGKNLASQVTNYSVLTTAREDYGILENIVTLIGVIGEAENTDEHFAKLNAAQAAYDALDDEDKPKAYLKAQLTEQKQVLDAAWYEYKLLLVKYVQLDMTMSDGVTKKNLVVFTNIPEGQMIELVGYTVSVMEIGADTYNMIVTVSELSEEALSDLSLVDVDTEPYMLGDVDNNGNITGNDASIANKYAARVLEALNVFANDPMAFVRADVNRSGTVTALDAFMIAQAGVANTTLEDPFVTLFN